MTEPFLQTLFPGQARVCGRKLPPLTLWRLQCLLAVGSPFLGMSPETPFTLADLLLALRVVSTPNRRAPNVRASWWDQAIWLLCRRNTRYLEHHSGLFVRYLSLHQIRPELWQCDDSSCRSLTAPYVLTQIVALMERGIGHEEAWNTAPGYATWLIAAAGERQSERVQFAHEDDEEHALAHDELDLRSEAEILAQAQADLPPEIFAQWVANRGTTIP